MFSFSIYEWNDESVYILLKRDAQKYVYQFIKVTC